eukprot:MONOS_1097.1-p1 / transcript=MONOS_1097.1 / gene=MONOS_1097 / organism=Monocercomonoides_exilis_PA203 / gene_product=UTP-glucose-1-phosphate uridylyltransferase / transcript_product=UTP-glucose-1-phosphate uridylyltransferase / location=Mono_scaffold00018:204409-205708(+) / protein_length=401 / sequence_SO=supercontig / SO=protein_coding / is_pseudo=false
MKKVAVVKLNGGLGTTMGLTGPKSTIVIKEKKNFLELTFEQIRHVNNLFHCSVPLVLMNSFNTEAETKKFVSKATDLNIICFNQNQFPRLNRETLMPIAKSRDDPASCWYPPGHGDLYDSLLASGTLDLFAKTGIEYIFVSNIDNLGATIEPKILNRLFKQGNDVLIELTPKTPTDIKGGTVIRYPTEKGELGYKLLEIAQVPAPYVGEFKSVRKFSVFNTNNIWIKVSFLREALETGRLQLDVISNPKTVNDIPVLQLETACGAIVSCSTKVDVVSVPRIRFIPTKTCSDLILIMSNYYECAGGSLYVNPKRNFSTFPVMSLGPCFSKIKDLAQRCPSPPDLVEMESLTTVGDVTFGADVVIKGNVVIVAQESQKIVIPPKAVLDNVTVTGSLQIIPRN